MHYIRLGFWLLLITALASPAVSHQVGGDSYLQVKVDGDAIQAQWGIALFSFGNVLALDRNNDGKIADEEAQDHLGMMADYALAHLKLSTAEGVCPLQPGHHEVVGRYAIVRFTPRCPMPLRALTIEYRLFFDVDPLHRGLLRLEYQHRTHTGIFTPARTVQDIQLKAARPWQQVLEYVIEGIWHIWIGFDHILFLIALLFPAGLRQQQGRWEAVADFRGALGPVLKIVTAFTVAHSLTLGAAVLDVVTAPPRLIESLIALSVVVAALNNLYPIIPTQRLVALTFGFGLIHGFGFANVLQELELPRDALVRSLLGFNLGVEIGQMAIVGIALPIVYGLRRQWIYPRLVVTFGSTATAAIALLWFLERAFDLPRLLPETPHFDPRAELQRLTPYVLPHFSHPLVIVGGLLSLLLGAMRSLWQRKARAGRVPGWRRLSARRLMNCGLALALGVLALGIWSGFGAARQHALVMAKAADAAAQLGEPLRHQLRVAEPRDMVYQAQLGAMGEAVAFLAEQFRQHDEVERLSAALEQLARGQTTVAQSLLSRQAEIAAARGDTAAAAIAERHRGALALLEDIATALDAYSRAVELDPQASQGWTTLACLLAWNGQYAEAESAARRALELTREANDPARIALAYENLGVIYQAKGTWEEAETMYREALNTYRVVGDEPGMARVYTHLGTLYGVFRRFDQAHAMYRDALSIHQRLADKEGMAVDYANLGAVYTARGLFKHGEAMYREAVELNELLDRKPGLALVYAELGHLYHRSGDGRQAEIMYRQALTIEEGLNYQPGIASASTALGRLYRQRGDLEQAVPMLRRAIAIDEALGHHMGLAINYANLASVYQRQGDLEQAEALYQQALAMNDRIGRRAGEAANYAHLGHVYLQRGDLEHAEQMYRKSLALFAEVGSAAGTAQVQVWLDALKTAKPTP